MSTAALSTPFTVEFDPNSQEFSLSGIIRPRSVDKIAAGISMLKRAIDDVRGVLYLNVKRLIQMNSTAFHAFARVVVAASFRRTMS